MPPVSYRPGRFTIDGLEGVFEGYTSGRLWNGWATPVFVHGTGLDIADAFRNQMSPDGSFRAHYDPAADAFVVQDPCDDEAVSYAAASILVDGHSVTVYPFGTDVWTWEELDAPSVASLPEHGYVTLQVVYEAGHHPLTGEALPREEETVIVAAPTPEHAVRLAMRHTRIDPRGRLVHFFDADGRAVYSN